jgi:NAD(P)-dependent dehydrogenase (short-subunit alcohol dehydrogenase family)
MSQTNALPNLFELTGKVAVVTGAAAGIGKATAHVLAAAGARVVAADRDIQGAQAVANELGNDSFAVEFDLESEASISSLFYQVGRACRRLDILINNAGIYPRYALNSVTETQWHSMQKINVWGCFVVLREAVRLINSILPGAVAPLDPNPKATGLSSPTGPLVSQGRILLGRAAHANEVAGPILMLVSAAGAYITGQTLIVDGGFSIS